MPDTKPIAKGGTAEWCPKCRQLVLPVRINHHGGNRKDERWACPGCYGPTEELSPNA